MTKGRRRTARASTRKKVVWRRARADAKAAKKRTAAAPAAPRTPRDAGERGPLGPTLRSRTQLEIRVGHGARALTATEQAARLASARMERRIGRLLSRGVKLKFR